MKYNSRTITIKLPSEKNLRRTEKRAKALAVLVGGAYNKYGRNIDIEKYNELSERYMEIVEEIENLL